MYVDLNSSDHAKVHQFISFITGSFPRVQKGMDMLSKSIKFCFHTAMAFTTLGPLIPTGLNSRLLQWYPGSWLHLKGVLSIYPAEDICLQTLRKERCTNPMLDASGTENVHPYFDHDQDSVETEFSDLSLCVFPALECWHGGHAELMMCY